MTHDAKAFSANEAAYVTGIPLKKLSRIVDAGLLGNSVMKRNGTRMFSKSALLGLKLADETTEILTLKGRKRLVCHILDNPEAKTVQEAAVSVDLRAMQRDLKRRIASLEKSKNMIVSNKETLSGTPCFKGTRIPVDYVAEMLANGDKVPEVLTAYPRLNEAHLTAAKIYAEAYPRRHLPRQQPVWRKIKPHVSKTIVLDKLPQGS